MTKLYNNDVMGIFDGILHDNMVIMAGGFGLCGIPEHAIIAIRDSGIRNITVISNNCGIDEFGLGILLQTRQIRKMISSYVGENKTFETQYLEGKLQLELVPQGTLAERIRAGGAGIPAFYTPTGVGTVVAKDKEVREFNCREYLLETALTADLAIIKAWKSDQYGNLIYRRTARNFNPIMATAGKVTVAEVEEIVDKLDADQIHTPNVFVDKVIVGRNFEKRIEKIVTQ